MAREKPQHRLRVLVVVITWVTDVGRTFKGIIFVGGTKGAKIDGANKTDALANSCEGIKSSEGLLELAQLVMYFSMYNRDGWLIIKS